MEGVEIRLVFKNKGECNKLHSRTFQHYSQYCIRAWCQRIAVQV